jgi:hypothetical protein
LYGVGTLLSDLSSSVEWWLPRHSTERSAVPLCPRERRGLIDCSVTPKGTLFTRFAFLKSRINNPPRSQHPVRPGGIAGNDVGPLHRRADPGTIPCISYLLAAGRRGPSSCRPDAAAHHISLNRGPPSRPSLIEHLIDICRTKICKASFFWSRPFCRGCWHAGDIPATELTARRPAELLSLVRVIRRCRLFLRVSNVAL